MAAAMEGLEATQERPRGGGSPRGHDRWKVVHMSLPAIQPPEDGERPVSVADAARLTGYSKDRIQKRIRRGILPSVMPLGYQRGRMVFVSQLRYVMERPVMVDARCA